jgi:hypothetical protein
MHYYTRPPIQLDPPPTLQELTLRLWLYIMNPSNYDPAAVSRNRALRNISRLKSGLYAIHHLYVYS